MHLSSLRATSAQAGPVGSSLGRSLLYHLILLFLRDTSFALEHILLATFDRVRSLVVLPQALLELTPAREGSYSGGALTIGGWEIFGKQAVVVS